LLRAIERRVRQRDELTDPLRLGRNLPDADADPHGNLVPLVHKACLTDLRAQVLPEARRVRRVALGQHDHELVTRIPSEELLAPNPLADQGREFAQHQITGQVPVAVVDRLEVVHVEEQQRERSLVALSTRDLAVRELLEITPIVDLRQTVKDGHAVDLFVVRGLEVMCGQVLEDRAADLDQRAVLERRARHGLRADPRAVRAAQVLEPPRVVDADQAAVQP